MIISLGIEIRFAVNTGDRDGFFDFSIWSNCVQKAFHAFGGDFDKGLAFCDFNRADFAFLEAA